ncbi:hypothetical protein GCM10009413_00140 [Tatumella punctata]
MNWQHISINSPSNLRDSNEFYVVEIGNETPRIASWDSSEGRFFDARNPQPKRAYLNVEHWYMDSE